MSEFRKLVEEVQLDQALGEDLGSIARNALLGAGIALGSMQGVDAKTNPEALYNGNHEITSKYEHGGKGYAAITKDNYGGHSYGKQQLSTRRINNCPSTFDTFLKYTKEKAPYIYNTLDNAGGWEGAYQGTDLFKQAWLQLADQKEFRDIYDNFITDTQILPVYNRMDQATSVNLDKITEWGSTNEAVQAAIQSAIIQHGRSGAFDMIAKVVKNNNPTTMRDFILQLYDYRAKKFPKYKSRYNSECSELLNCLVADNLEK